MSNWLDTEPTPYDELPEYAEHTGRLGTTKINREMLHDQGYHVETNTTFLQRYWLHSTQMLAEKVDKEMMDIKTDEAT